MRILHIISSANPAAGGPVEALRQICAVQRLGGYAIDVASMDSPAAIAWDEGSARLFPLGPCHGVYGYSWGAARWLKKNIESYDAAFIHGVWQYNTVAAYRALKGAGIPYAVFAHGMLDPYFKSAYPLKHWKKRMYWYVFLREILSKASAVLFACDEERELARQSFVPYRVTEAVMPLGIFDPPCNLNSASVEFLARWPELQGKQLALTMGRITPKKGTDLLIESFAATMGHDPAWRLVIAGPDDGGLRRKLESRADRLGIAGQILWTGMLQGSLKWGALAAAEVFVLPSHQENFGMVLAEAIACSLPVIVSDKVNIWPEIGKYRAGLICEDTVNGTIDGLQRWLALSGEEIAGYRLRSRQCFDELFNYAVTSKGVLDFVDSLVAQKRKKF